MREKQEQARNQLPQMDDDGLMGCQQKKQEGSRVGYNEKHGMPVLPRSSAWSRPRTQTEVRSKLACCLLSG